MAIFHAYNLSNKRKEGRLNHQNCEVIWLTDLSAVAAKVCHSANTQI
jgi:hypothetical protein